MCQLKILESAVLVLLVLWSNVARYAVAAAEQPVPDEKVQIVLRDEVQVDQALVRLRDVAAVEGASLALVERIRQLDLYEFAGSEAIDVSQSHVKIRLLLAGLNDDQFDIAGSDRVVIRPTGVESSPASRGSNETVVQTSLAGLAASIQDTIQRKLSQAFSIQPDDVIVKLNSSLNDHELDQFAEFDPRTSQLELLGGARDVLGGRRLRFAVTQEHDTLRVLNVFAETSMLIKTPVASTMIAAGDIFSRDNVTFQTNELKIPPRELLSEAVLFGKASNRRISVGAEISLTSIQSPSAASSQQAQDVIKARDAVIVTAQVGGVIVRLNNATALQAGKRGDFIRVRNENSQNVVTCRILAANQVEAIVHR